MELPGPIAPRHCRRLLCLPAKPLPLCGTWRFEDGGAAQSRSRTTTVDGTTPATMPCRYDCVYKHRCTTQTLPQKKVRICLEQLHRTGAGSGGARLLCIQGMLHAMGRYLQSRLGDGMQTVMGHLDRLLAMQEAIFCALPIPPKPCAEMDVLTCNPSRPMLHGHAVGAWHGRGVGVAWAWGCGLLHGRGLGPTCQAHVA